MELEKDTGTVATKRNRCKELNIFKDRQARPGDFLVEHGEILALVALTYMFGFLLPL